MKLFHPSRKLPIREKRWCRLAESGVATGPCDLRETPFALSASAKAEKKREYAWISMINIKRQTLKERFGRVKLSRGPAVRGCWSVSPVVGSGLRGSSRFSVLMGIPSPAGSSAAVLKGSERVTPRRLSNLVPSSLAYLSSLLLLFSRMQEVGTQGRVCREMMLKLVEKTSHFQRKNVRSQGRTQDRAFSSLLPFSRSNPVALGIWASPSSGAGSKKKDGTITRPCQTR